MAEPAKKSKEEAKVEVERTGDRILVPANVTLEKAVETLKNQITYENEAVVVRENIPGCFWDGAYAFYRAMQKKFGWVQAKPIPSFFGEQKPEIHSIENSIDSTVNVPIGRFTVPNVEGFLQTGHTRDSKGRVIFQINAQVKRRYEATIKELAEMARQILVQKSLYKGKAIRARFKSDDGEDIVMIQPQFLDLRRVDQKALILPDIVRDAVETSVFTPIRHTKACRENNIPLKRGVLLSGKYGTGKTLTAYVTAKHAEDNGWTFIYCERTDELPHAIRFAQQYQPAAIFCEDIDRIMSGGRTLSIDEVLNIIDGIESKNTELMVVLTTNHIENINKAMLRPGRLDAVINFTAPDAAAVEQLIRHYGKGLIASKANLAEVGKEMEGRIPAFIREAVERAKLSAVKINGGDDMTLTSEALLDAARGMRDQLDLMADAPEKMNEYELLGRLLKGGSNGDMAEVMASVARKVRDIHDEVVG